MKKLFYTSLIIILTVSCSQKKFDKNKWRNAELEEKFGIIDPIGYLYLELEFDDSEKLAHWRIFETEFEE